jgi:hypothetical protein
VIEKMSFVDHLRSCPSCQRREYINIMNGKPTIRVKGASGVEDTRRLKLRELAKIIRGEARLSI